MKKLLSIACMAICMASCSDSATKKETDTTTETTAPVSEAERRAKEIADSTKMLDKKLADPNDPTTPDSLK